MAFKVDFSSSLAASTPPAAPSKTKFQIAGWATCGFYQKTKTVLTSLQALFPDRYEVVVHESNSRDEYREVMPDVRSKVPDPKAHNHTSSPFVAIGEDLMSNPEGCSFVGGCDDTLAYARGLFGNGGASPALAPAALMVNDGYEAGNSFDYDLVVIGGGSGGMAASKEAAKLGARVCVLDYVKPSPLGTTWGLGGTCVNVGCIPKKLMHQASILGEAIKHDAPHFGWQGVADAKHDWPAMVADVQRYIKSLNFAYRVALRDANVKYINGLGKFAGPHEMTVTEFKGKDKVPKETTITAARFLVATGGRPTALGCEGSELAISSDDLFSLPQAPGKTLCVGAGYVALECAGFLTALGCDTTVLCRSMLLRGFDRECCDKIGAYMEHGGTKILRGLTPSSLAKQANGQILVTYSDGSSDTFDTVIAAVGRTADTKGINLEACGVEASPRNGKFETNLEQTNVPHVYAIGDVLQDKPELTPVAIQAGALLAQRLFGGGNEAMEYEKVATAVFTPLEYGAVGLSEEAAAEAHSSTEVFHSSFAPLEWSLSHERDVEKFPAFVKVICDSSLGGNKDLWPVLGMHYLGPNAGEVIQGYAVAVKKGCNYGDLQATVGIHPTTSEQFTTVKVTKSSGASADAAGC